MNFWAKTAIRYFVVALSAMLLALVVSALVAASIAKEGDNLGVIYLWASIFFPLLCLLISASLGITAELIQRKVSRRPFAWQKALLRSVIALPIGPLSLISYFSAHRPMRPVVYAILFVMCTVFAYFALRIKGPYPSPEPDGWWPSVRE